MHLILQTDRLSLRRFNNNDEDANLILHMNNRPEVLQYLHEPLLQNLLHAKEILVNIILPQYENELGRWGVFLKESNEFIGWCGFKYRPERKEIDLGYRFLPSAWGKGYGTESAKACLRYGFEQLGLKKINACAHIENTGSLAILKKIGMQYTHDEIIDECPVKCFVVTDENYSGTSAFS